MGYKKLLFILPFDHRSTFAKGMFKINNEEDLTAEQKEKIKNEKRIIYDAFKKAVDAGTPKEYAAILVDEEYGDEILKDASSNGFITLVTTEKSGQKEFSFEYGNEFGEHIKKYNPTFAKALVRYNPEDDRDSKERQAEQLKKLKDFCQKNDYKFMIEVLIEATEDQLASVGNDRNRFDTEIRQKLALGVIKEFQEQGIDPDVWKMEGMEKEEDYKRLIDQAREGGRESVGIVVLGRGADQGKVEKWISEGASIEGIIGFAVGRTIFWDPLVMFSDGRINREEVVDQISKNYIHFYNLFMQERQGA
ncbi:MAG: DUF2090 domain-containing protein [Candidatus Levybacteria bacterium]|nr:DUF2090 domain-containing protein [Candidatus Levybacteria bacterium]